jgi:photosystem II stability/assembly factor-like uncharacterized protein
MTGAVRRWRRLMVACVLLLVTGCGGSKPHHPRTATTAPPPSATTTSSRPATTPAVPAGGPVPAGFVPRSFTAIGERTWWLLGTATCSSPPCTSIVRTSDGGAHFVGIPAPRTPYESSPGSSGQTSGVSQLRFADPRDGFAYGSSLYVTHDGGTSWHPVSVSGAIGELAIAGGDVYAIVGATGGGPGRLLRAPIRRDQWTMLTAAGSVAGGLWAHGADVFVQSGDNTALLISRDHGANFSRYRSPVPGLGCEYEEMQPPVVWAHCATGTESGVWRSTDGGRTFRLASGGSTSRMMLPNAAAFAAASTTTAVVGYQQLYRTADAGASYQPVGPAGLTWAYLGFTDATHGAALALAPGGGEQLFYSTNAGLSYAPVAIG